ncbi:MAG: SpoIID/LytB domain-containing protein [Elusimicrobia bacterium]|nr:SpoIID/LytB domain-containing protein [Elusimicrobiota bacterium]
MDENLKRLAEVLSRIKPLLLTALLFIQTTLPVYSSGNKHHAPLTVRVFEGEKVLISSPGGFRLEPLERGRRKNFGLEWVEFFMEDSSLRTDEETFQAGAYISPKLEPLAVNGRSYRGNLILIPLDGKVRVINEVEVEDYLRGVLPVEVHPEWPLEALKVQAVVSRTYVYNNIGKNADKGFDLTDDVFSQVYRGKDVETENTDRAVKETRGQLIYLDGAPIPSYFFSCCGGHTEDVRKVWSGSFSHMEGVECIYCADSPRYSWSFTISPEEISDRLKSAGYFAGDILDIKLISRTNSGRIDLMELKTSTGTLSITGHQFRMALGPDNLKSALFAIDRSAPDYNFYGRGWGHGVGICQWGSRGLADQGAGFKEILKFYLPGIDIRRIH